MLASVGKLIKMLKYMYILSLSHDVGQITLRLGNIAATAATSPKSAPQPAYTNRQWPPA
jgi:hypothetical protein